jgi:hypothetical protein
MLSLDFVFEIARAGVGVRAGETTGREALTKSPKLFIFSVKPLVFG